MTTNISKTAVFMIGSPGAGKSFIAKQIAVERNYELIDCDAWKLQHPDYDPNNPSAVHAWSKLKSDAQLSDTMADNKSFIYDGTGANAENTINRIRRAQEEGYKTEAIFVTCSLATAIERNASRTRKVSESMLREKFASVALTFEIVTNYVDSVSTVNND